jgi:hypothetical protein
MRGASAPSWTGGEVAAYGESYPDGGLHFLSSAEAGGGGAGRGVGLAYGSTLGVLLTFGLPRFLC